MLAEVAPMSRLTIPRLHDTIALAEDRNRNSKNRMMRASRIAREEWSAVWPDLTVTAGGPAVENVFVEAAEDKAASAGAILPTFLVPPRRGTRNDRSETNAQKARRVYVTLGQNSGIDRLLVGFYMDWFVFGLPTALAWKDWEKHNAMPYLVAVDPLTVYPVSWDQKGELAEGLIIKRRRAADLIADYGPGHPAFSRVLGRDVKKFYKEVIWATQDEWAVALTEDTATVHGDFRAPLHDDPRRAPAAWLRAPSKHLLNGCPIIAYKAHAIDREIRGKLDGMLPNLKNAHEWQLEFNLNLRRAMHAPPLIQNVEDPDTFGHDVIMEGVRGPDEAVIAYPRPPVDFAAIDQVDRQIAASRNAGHYPLQRMGDPGASIASGDAVQLLQGGFNSQMAWAQMDMARFLTAAFMRLASMDEAWSTGEREIDGFDAGEAFTDKYDPTTFWKGDHRVFVTFHAVGVDTHTNLLNMGAAHRLGWLPSRDAMERSGLVANALAAERQKSLEYLVQVFEQGVLPQAVQAQQYELFLEYMDMLDGDKFTPQAAVAKIVTAMTEQAAAQPQQPPGAPGGPAPQVTPEMLALIGGGGPQ